MTPSNLIEIGILLAALFAGLRGYRALVNYQKFYLFQVLIWLVFYFMSHIVQFYQLHYHSRQDNQWVYNVSTFFEIVILLRAAMLFFAEPKTKKIILASMLLYVGLDILTLFVQDFYRFNVIGFVIGSFFITLFYANMLYKIISESAESTWREPMFSICIGILLFYVCNLPYFSFFNYLNSHHLQLSTLFYKIITQVLANIRYVFLGLGFWLIIRKPISST